MDYNEIFDVESKKLLGLFNALRYTDNSKSLDTLSKELGINSKTIIRAIKKLKKLFKRYQLEQQLAIGCRDRNQFYLKRQDDQYLEFFLVQYLNDLPEIIFLKTIIEEKNVTTKQLIGSMLVSESSLRRRAKKINGWLKKFNLHLKRGTWELIGEEEQIRALVLPFYWFAYQETKPQSLLCTIENSRELAIKFISFFNMKINDLQKETITRITQIAFWRYQGGNKVWIKKSWKQYIENSATFSKFMAVMDSEGSATNLDFEELVYLYLMIQAYFLPYFGSNNQIFLIGEHYLKKTTCYLRTLTANSKLRHISFGGKLSHSKESLVAFLSFHLYYELLSGFPFEKKYLKMLFTENYPNFTRKLSLAVNELMQENDYYQRIPKDTIWYRYFMIVSSLISPVSFEKRIFICLMTDLPLEMETKLGKRITHFFMHKFNLTIIYARTSKSISYADIILTTVVYQSLHRKYPQPTLLIEAGFSEKTLYQVEKLIKKVMK
ncbi:hypothetical protein A5819_002609 [Enterococcus sp. 7E2_DIV0204]|nr:MULTISPECIES: helix-turn-helix domain-containing protein [unclassified Enterococcus]OTN90110.1 hypothetical protein A5819_002609 [Enterococcus sp. 7E2_DIV0204]OTP52565.1 hypothetical protein A5884_001767 [Enterococcus sp. 7D2_DIV0200]